MLMVWGIGANVFTVHNECQCFQMLKTIVCIDASFERAYDEFVSINLCDLFLL